MPCRCGKRRFGEVRGVAEMRTSVNSRLDDAFRGSLLADAAAMPVHWYYDTACLDRDYPDFRLFLAPRGCHPNSILWRSRYVPSNDDADILHDQAAYWGKRDVHYHQFLRAGENTLNFKLAAELYLQVRTIGRYDPDLWLETYVDLMRTPGWHRDTYVEECHREFFKRRAAGLELRECGIEDIHIGGLAMVPALVAGLAASGEADEERLVSSVRIHVGLTHVSAETLDAAEALTRILIALAWGMEWAEAVDTFASSWINRWGSLDSLGDLDDRVVVGRHFTSACYLPDSFSASLWLCSKYWNGFEEGVVANSICGGDNCHRGAVVGSVLGALNGVPERLSGRLVGLEPILGLVGEADAPASESLDPGPHPPRA